MVESNKTGSGTPKPFIYETAMHSLLNNNPAFGPLLCKSSSGQIQTNYDAGDENDRPKCFYKSKMLQEKREKMKK